MNGLTTIEISPFIALDDAEGDPNLAAVFGVGRPTSTSEKISSRHESSHQVNLDDLGGLRSLNQPLTPVSNHDDSD